MRKLSLLFFVLLSVFAFSLNAQNVSGKCYRGFADFGYTFGLGDCDMGRFEFNTSHGYQFNPHFFLGAGMGWHLDLADEVFGGVASTFTNQHENNVEIPIFANFRANFTETRFSPFVDAKIGTHVTNGSGLYASASLGCRIATTKKQGINIFVGYTYAKYRFHAFDNMMSLLGIDYTRNTAVEGLSLKIGYEF